MPKTPKKASKTPPDLSHIAAGLQQLVIPIAEIIPDAANSRSHDRANLDAIKGSLRQFGQTTPLIVQDDSGVLRAGHGRLAAARELITEGDQRWERMAVLRVAWDNVTGTAFSIADNRTAELADWDPAALEKQLREINVGDADLQQMFTNLAEELELIVAEEPEQPEPPAEVPERFQVVVTCTDEDQQKMLLRELDGRGIEARGIVS